MQSDMTQALRGAHILVCGIANERSLAYAIAQAVVERGGEVWCTWQGDAQYKRVQRCVQHLGARAHVLARWDVVQESDGAQVVKQLQAQGVYLHGLVHAIAFAQLHSDTGETVPVHGVDATRWSQALQISAWSLPMMLHTLLPCMDTAGMSAVTLTYQGSRVVMPGYNMMGVAKAALESAVRYCAAELGGEGVRVNAVSAGSIRTVAAAAVPGFSQRHQKAAAHSPMCRTVEAQEVAATVAWLLSPDASAITGAVIPVDAGLHIMGPG
ncbi:MAG: SDR family oxidoreductase [Planctomycetota bacterium]|nr:MAG: SDR family oxidoreductase [Planctomycetota bacterium]